MSVSKLPAKPHLSNQPLKDFLNGNKQLIQNIL